MRILFSSFFFRFVFNSYFLLRYHAGNNWGMLNSTYGCVGCGAQEEFYGCADIKINPIKTESASSSSLIDPNFNNADSSSSIMMPKSIVFSRELCPSEGFQPVLIGDCKSFVSCSSVGTRFEHAFLFQCESGFLFDRKANQCSSKARRCERVSVDVVQDAVEASKEILADFVQVNFILILILFVSPFYFEHSKRLILDWMILNDEVEHDS